MRKQIRGGSREHVLNYFLSQCQIEKVPDWNKFGQTHHAWKSSVAKILTVDTVSKLRRSEPTCRHLSSSAGHQQRTMRLISPRKADYSCLGRAVLRDRFLSCRRNILADFTIKWKYKSRWKALKSKLKLELWMSKVNYSHNTQSFPWDVLLSSCNYKTCSKWSMKMFVLTHPK